MELKKHIYNFNPTAAQLVVVGPTSFGIMGVKRGTRIKSVAVRVGVAFNGTGPTISIGDGTGATIFATAAQVACAATGLKDGYGTAFSGSNGKLYTGNDTVDLVYTGAADVTTGACSVIVTYTEEE